MERLELVLAKANQLRAQGWSLEEINAKLQEAGFGTYDKLVAQVRAAPPSEPYRATSRDVLRSMGQGATAGFLDEITGALAAVTPGGKGYTEARDLSRERNKDFREYAPAAALVSELLGAGALAAGTAGMAPSAASVGGRVAQGALAGGTYGGVAGAGYSEANPNSLEFLRDIGTGASVGGGFGALAGMFPLGAQAAGQQGAANAISKTLDRGGISSLEEAAAAGRAVRPNQFVAADVDPALASLARRRAARGPESRAVAGRGAQENERLLSDLRTLSRFGDETAAEAKEAAIVSRNEVRDNMYKALDAEFATLPPTPAMAEILGRRTPRRLWRQITGDLEPGVSPGLTHYQDLISQMRKSDSQTVRNLGRQLHEHVDNITGGRLTEANAAYREASAVIDAFDAGAAAFKGQQNLAAIERSMNQFMDRAGVSSAAEAKSAFRHGYLDAMIARFQARPAQSAARDITARNRDVLRSMFDSQEDFNQFFRAAEIEAQMQAATRGMRSPRFVEEAEGIAQPPITRVQALGRIANIVMRPSRRAIETQERELARKLLTPEGLTELLKKRPRSLAPSLRGVSESVGPIGFAALRPMTPTGPVAGAIIDPPR